MSSSPNISNISYNYPIAKNLNLGDNPTIDQIKTAYNEQFKSHKTTLENLFNQLNNIFGIKDTKITLPISISVSDFIKNICDDCDESNTAYKFYGCKIINKINQLSDYITEANAIIERIGKLTGDESTKNNQAHSLFVQLECLDNFCSEIAQEFGNRYLYDSEEDIWKLKIDDYNKSKNSQLETNKYDNLDNLRSIPVEIYPNPNKKGTVSKTIECFNELNLLDRLTYIKLYYDITQGKTDYVFPNDKNLGFPCVKEDESSETRIGNLEKFFLGYLIDRDGPINAFVNFFEIKTSALRSTIALMSEKIKALNVYLAFINRALNLLNESQSSKNEKIPDGTVIAMTYLCDNTAYNLFEDKTNNQKYLVIPYEGKYLLVRADESGMRFLLGDGKENDYNNSNGSCYLHSYANETYKIFILYAEKKADGTTETKEISPILNVEKNNESKENVKPTAYYANEKANYADDHTKYHYDPQQDEIHDFKLPRPIPEVQAIAHKSILNYQYARSKEADNKVVTSWQDALQKKTSYIDTAIESINTDIEVFRNKIDTFDSMCSQLNSRVQDVYLNTIKNTNQ